jgi:hypothetical protein
MNKFFKLYLNGFKKSTAASNDSIPVDYSKIFTKSPDASFFTKLYVFLIKNHVNNVMREFYQSDRYREIQRLGEEIKKYEY